MYIRTSRSILISQAITLTHNSNFNSYPFILAGQTIKGQVYPEVDHIYSTIINAWKLTKQWMSDSLSPCAVVQGQDRFFHYYSRLQIQGYLHRRLSFSI